MCTLTYFPLKSGFIATVNRDESPLRHAPRLFPHHNELASFLIAKEPVHGGSNLAVSSQGQLTTLLNGAFQPHDPTLKYGRSRGLILLDSLRHNTLADFAQSAEFQSVEPFTMIRIDAGTVEEMRWDGARVFYNSHDSRYPNIWASAQLYSSEVIEARRRWFDDLLGSRHEVDASLLEKFHLQGGDGDPANDMVMNRLGLVMTVSVSQLVLHESALHLNHRDLLGKEVFNYSRSDWEKVS